MSGKHTDKQEGAREQGFTLVEVMVAITLFVIVLTGLTGTFLSMLSATRVTQSNQLLFQNANIALDLMVRHIREGSGYDCDLSSPALNDCSSGQSEFTFVDRNEDNVTYWLEGGAIMRNEGDGPVQFTAEGVEVTDLQFYVVGNQNVDGEDYQPRVRIVVVGRAGELEGESTDIYLQTTVSQRLDPEAINAESDDD